MSVQILIDGSPNKIKTLSETYGREFWQLRTPLTRNAIADVPWALDNGCFKRFDKPTWLRMLREAESHRPVFVTLPDMVGDAVRTLDLFEAFRLETNEVPRALVLQDGIGMHRIPWEYIAAVFVGGSDAFKISQEARNACKAAKMLDKWVHVGRVNTYERMSNWLDLADSIDGSGISIYPHMLENVLYAIDGGCGQYELGFSE